MRTLMLALAAASLTLPALAVPAAPAAAAFGAPRTERVQTWRGADGRLYCRKPDGRVGLVVGGRGGALGNGGDRRGSYSSDSVLGAAVGALLGRDPARDRASKRRCR